MSTHENPKPRDAIAPSSIAEQHTKTLKDSGECDITKAGDIIVDPTTLLGYRIGVAFKALELDPEASYSEDIISGIEEEITLREGARVLDVENDGRHEIEPDVLEGLFAEDFEYFREKKELVDSYVNQERML